MTEMMMNRDDDRKMMELALQRAAEAGGLGEVPVGAVVVDGEGRVVSSAGNKTIGRCDPTGHAEIRALRLAAAEIKNYRLPGMTVYVTLEPCPMCASAMVHARIRRVVYGAADPKPGAIVSKYAIGSDNLLNHTFEVTGGILEEECSRLLRNFFQNRR